MRRNGEVWMGVVLFLTSLTLLAGCTSPIPNEPRPQITYVSFPSRVVANGSANQGTIGFSDTHGDIARVEFSSGGQVTGGWDPGVQGQMTGTIPFSQPITEPGNYTVQVKLIDVGGRISNSYSFSFEADAAPPVAYRVTVSQITDEFEANEVAGELKYRNKLTAVSGYITRFGTFGDEPIVVLSPSASDDVFDPQVLCYFAEEDAPVVAGLTKGSFVTIVGEYWLCGYESVYFHNCYVE